MDGEPEYDLAGRVIGCAMAVHRALGHGFLEIVYRNALIIELGERQIAAIPEAPIQVFYRDREVGRYQADLLVEGSLIVEIKAIESLGVIHEVQLVNYLTATGIDVGLLLNFGRRTLEYHRKSRRLQRPPGSRTDISHSI